MENMLHINVCYFYAIKIKPQLLVSENTTKALKVKFHIKFPLQTPNITVIKFRGW